MYRIGLYQRADSPVVHLETCKNVLPYQHYRVVDVSTIKELTKRWSPEAAKGVPEKKLNHRALDDIRESIEELRYYRETVFK